MGVRGLKGGLVVAVAVVVSGCCIGGCGNGEAETSVGWTVGGTVGAREVRLAVPVDTCKTPNPKLEKPRIEYAGTRVYIELTLKYSPNAGGPGGGCLLEGLVVRPRVRLDIPVMDAELYDLSTSPPSLRWPLK